MKPLRFRQVHLDFHTSPDVPAVGDKFDKKQFQDALKAAHADSITIFAKCHHGWGYYPGKKTPMHPKLKFDLLKAQLDACAEIGVNAPVYLSAGWDEVYCFENPHHINKVTPNGGYDFATSPGWHRMCFNTPYMEYLAQQIEEVMELYNPSGIFLDISYPKTCYCNCCLKSMRELGLDPMNPDDMDKHADIVYEKYAKRCEEAVRKYNPNTTIFHNGFTTPGRRDHISYQTHLELESLPTGGWGYDHFPMSAAYSRTQDKYYLGMTGKFHKSWGEFGGFKHPNALRYEAALSLSQGARCSIGDQLHPNGEMNMSTYNLIGKAYAEVEVKEPYIRDVKHFADVAILSCEALNHQRGGEFLTADMGASRALLEGKYLFNIVDQYEDLTPYKLVILADFGRLDEEMTAKIKAYVAGGGKILCSGKSGMKKGADELVLDLGIKHEGLNEFIPNYMIPEYEAINGRTAYIMYQQAYNISVTNGSVEALLEDSYFNRTAQHFCSHQHTPNNPGADRPAAVLTANTGYIAWNVFTDYAKMGEYHTKELILHMIEALVGDKRTVRVENLPDRGVVTYTYQESQSRYIAHLLFAHTSKRGDNVEIIEDIIPVYGVKLTANVSAEPKRVYRVDCKGSELTETDIAYKYENGKIIADVDKVDLHAMVVIDI